MNEFLIGLGTGAFIGSIVVVLILRPLLSPDYKIGKIIARGRGNQNEIDLDIKVEDKKRKLFKRKK